jgi:hypothetical protein
MMWSARNQEILANRPAGLRWADQNAPWLREKTGTQKPVHAITFAAPKTQKKMGAWMLIS